MSASGRSMSSTRRTQAHPNSVNNMPGAAGVVEAAEVAEVAEVAAVAEAAAAACRGDLAASASTLDD
jgi:hypothetical protein